MGAVRAFRLEMAARKKIVRCYARNDGLGLNIPYEWYNVDRSYEPDYLVHVLPCEAGAPGLTVALEIKGMLTEQDKAKHEAARRWIAAVNNWWRLAAGLCTFAAIRKCWSANYRF